MPQSHQRIALISICLSYFMVIIDITMVNVALPSIQHHLHASIHALQWIMDGYVLSFAVLLLLAGNLTDKLGAKTVFLVGLGSFTLTSLFCALSNTALTLIIWRILQGIGAALIVPASLALIHHSVDTPAQKSKAIGLWAGIGGIAAALGPILGALLVASFNWRAIFYINLPVGSLVLYLGCRYINGTHIRLANPFDALGQVLCLIWVGALTFCLIEMGRLGLHAPIVLSSIVIFAISLIAFIITEQRLTYPMLPLKYFKKPGFTMALCLGGMINVSTFGLLFILPLYFQHIQHFSVLMTGFAIVPLFILVALSSYLSGQCIHRIGEKAVILTGLCIGIIGYLGLLWTINLQHAHYIGMILPLCGIGFALAFIMPAATVMIIGSVEKNNAGFASAIFNMARQLGTLIGVGIFGNFITSSHHFLTGMSLSLGTAAVLYLAGIFGVISIR